MRSSISILSIFLFLLLLLQISLLKAKKPFIVYLGDHWHAAECSEAFEKATADHYDFLGSILKDKEKAKDAIFYSYNKHINGFAAYLKDEEALEISKHPKVVSVFPSRGYKLHTTRSWNFLGLERNGVVPKESLWTRASFGEDTIIGNLDTGVWPEADSFRDYGLGPVPSKWRGICQNDSAQKFTCNRKLIGARYFSKGYEAFAGSLNATFASPRDFDGHGTHTLSTAAGNFVPAANIFGYGNGTAKGGSPRARVAAYKVCWAPVNGSECFDADILAAFDAAIHDGVHVLSVSLGGDPANFLLDGLAIGSFHAVRNGVTVVASAGNSGPNPSTVSNLAPWIVTVGASTIDREFPSYIYYSDGTNKRRRIKGQSLSPTMLPKNKLYPIIKSVDAKAFNASDNDAELCFTGTLDPAKVKGKIVVCFRGVNARVAKGLVVLQAGGIGMVLANDANSGNEIIADAHVLPATHISYAHGLILYTYLNSTKDPVGSITKPHTQLGTKPAPFMAAFSSRGPNIITPEILKPDITAPGVSVLAAYTGAAGPAGLDFDTRRVAFNSESGTSMSCPHISGIAGLLKTLYPHWSPAAIKSAIMTSARTQDNMNQAIVNSSFWKANPFSYGSGHVRPNRAMNPGLVYDLNTTDYLTFLCSMGYNSTQLALFSKTPYSCPSERLNREDLNYPSITVPDLVSPKNVTRRLKNVGSPGTYTVRVIEPRGVSVFVKPASLKFNYVGEEKMFEVSLTIKKGAEIAGYQFGGLIWSDGKHYVRTPLVVMSGNF